MNKDYICPECGYHGDSPKLKTSYEYADADGNRGIMEEWLFCEDCGQELFSDDFR